MGDSFHDKSSRQGKCIQSIVCTNQSVPSSLHRITTYTMSTNNMLQSNWMLMGESQESTQVIEVPLSPRARSPPSFPPPAWPQDILQHFLQGEQKRECFGPVGERRGGMQQGI